MKFKKENRGSIEIGRKLHLWLLIVFIAGSEMGFAQTVIMQQDVNADTSVSNFGRNRKHFTASFIGVGMMIGQSEGDSSFALKSGGSRSFSYGNYYKMKFGNTYSILLSASYRVSRFARETEKDQKYNRLILNEVLGEFSNRFNFGQRGDYIGNYLEIGVSADYAFNNKTKSKSTPDDKDLAYKHRKVVLSNLSYIEKLNYSGHFRIGINKLILTADYRLSELIKNTGGFTLPPLLVGFRLDIGA